jgi:hypothetical protein
MIALRRLAVVLLALLLHAQEMFPPQTHGDMEARLTVQAANQTPVLGLGAVTMTLTVTGPTTLEVEEPHLGDATATWKEERFPETRIVADQRTTWSQVIRLKQVKPGVVPVADVSVRFRDGPGTDWSEAHWIDIFKQARDVPHPPIPPVQSSWLRRWELAPILALVGLLLAVWMFKRRRGKPAPLLPEQHALRELERIEQGLMPPRGDAEVFHTQLSHIVRRFLTERFGLHALQQTTAEFLAAVRQTPDWSAEQQARLRDFFERCDLAKFARARTPPEECRRTAELARELVRQTTRTFAG